MHTHCSCCGLRYERETGFFFGAMYVSYALNVALFIAAFAAYRWFFPKLNGLTFFCGYLLLAIILYPILFRMGRMIWLNVFVEYKSDITI
jgi:hypothetical protein